MARISLDKHRTLADPDDQAWWDKLNQARSGKGETRHVFQVNAALPELAYILSEVGLYLRRPNNLAAKYREAAILAVAQQARCGYVFAHHTPDALKAGIQPQDIEAIRFGKLDAIGDEDVATIARFTVAIAATGRCTDDLYDQMKSKVGDDETVLLLLVVNIAHYTSTTRILGAFDVRLEDGRQIFEDGS